MELYSQEKQEKKTDVQNQHQRIKKMATGTCITIITLNVNGLNAPSKRHRLAEWIQIKTHIYSVYKGQEAFNKRLPVCCFGSVRNPLALIDS